MAPMGRKTPNKHPSHGKRDVTPDTSKPTAIFKPGLGHTHTLSVAIPGSIIANAQSHELKSTLAGQIGRAMAVFNVDEVIIFNDGDVPKRESTFAHRPRACDPPGHASNTTGSGHPSASASSTSTSPSHGGSGDDRYTGVTDPCYFLAHLLSYLETPPHLRRALFPMHPDLRMAGMLPSLDMPHHGWPDEQCRYREGVTVASPAPVGAAGGAAGSEGPPPAKRAKRAGGGKEAPPPPTSVFVDAGLPRLVTIPDALPLHTRVTMRFDGPIPTTTTTMGGDRHPTYGHGGRAQFPTATPVAPATPREEGGFYWGYTVRTTSSLTEVFTESPFEDGYDVSIGTSERGICLEDLSVKLPEVHAALRDYRHLLIVFGGVAGLEKAVAADETLRKQGIGPKDAGQVFDAWVNLVSGQGSRTIRTEEALWIGLMGTRSYVDAKRVEGG